MITIEQQLIDFVVHNYTRCGLQGIVAQIHSLPRKHHGPETNATSRIGYQL